MALHISYSCDFCGTRLDDDKVDWYTVKIDSTKSKYSRKAFSHSRKAEFYFDEFYLCSNCFWKDTGLGAPLLELKNNKPD